MQIAPASYNPLKSLYRGHVMRWITILLFCCLPGFAAAGPLTGKKPNIIVLITDDQGYGDLSCHGNPILKTPNLDRLHAEGARFTDYMVSPTCAPTRSSFLSGKHEFKNGITHTINERERMSLKTHTLAQSLKQAGYATGIFGKWHLGDEDAYQPDRRGFDEVFIHGAGGIGQSFPGSCGDAPGNSYFNPYIRHNGSFVKTRGYCTDVFFQQATMWMEKTKGKQPFFAMITTNAPHAPLDARPEDIARYAGKVPENVAKFFGMIANIDDNVGILLDRLKTWGIDNDTLFIFFNDNGGTAGVNVFNANMRATKGTPYRGGTRGACFARWPGTITPGDRPQMAAHLDWFPTLAAMTGAPVPDTAKQTWDGRSLLPTLENATAAWEDRFLFTHVGRWNKGLAAQSAYANCAVRWKNYTMVSVQAKKDKTAKPQGWELYDIAMDPKESKNIRAEKPDVLATMTKAYDAWWTSVLPLLENEDAVGPKENSFHTAFWKQFPKR
jgi:arylsulfatase A-like enzyme